MSKRRVIIRSTLKPDADPALVEKLKVFMQEEFPPALRKAPGLLSLEFAERFRGPVTHAPSNKASDFALIELWQDGEANHRWWAGNQTERWKKVWETWRTDYMPVFAELAACHYTVVE
jgi:hypothetical protein